MTSHRTRARSPQGTAGSKESLPQSSASTSPAPGSVAPAPGEPDRKPDRTLQFMFLAFGLPMLLIFLLALLPKCN